MGFYENVGRLNPVAKNDQWNRLENFTISTFLTGADAYDTAIRLANLIKSTTNGSPITFEPNLPEFKGQIDVVQQAEQKEALTLTYPAGTTDYVEVDLGLTRVGPVQGSESNEFAETPTDSGDGPIRIQTSSTSVALRPDIEVERAVGRPSSAVHRNVGEQPRYIEKRKAAYDAFSLSFTAVNNVTQTVTDLIDLFRTRRGTDNLVLDFNGLYGLGQFNVQPQGSAALRHVARAGEGEVRAVPTIDLRVVSPR